ncbi:iron(III) transport system permease protein [Alteribacillus iranensis]|uniref:Iron(III) transport system permease protein n=2 Tax=Alteribacillus iranensis TaxID=930128 RepID=A0A1I2DIY5_9BACI|nr:iron(III) transport system permease protein [Alteribacillus iranensis]
MGALLVFVKTIGEFGTPVTLGNRIGYYVLTSEIHRHATIWPIDYGTAAILSTMLISASMLVWFLQQWMAARRNDTVVTGKGQSVSIYRLGKAKVLAWVYVLLVFGLAIGVPYLSVVSTAFLDVQGDGLALHNFTFAHMIELFTDSGGREALLNSLGLAGIAATVSVCIGVWISITVTRQKAILTKAIDFLSLAPNTLPAIVFIIGLILLWNANWMPIPIYNTWGMLVLAYVILYLPFTVQNIKAIYGQMSHSLLHAAQVSGAGRFYQFRTILLPLILPGVLAGWMMTFIISMRELVGSLILRPPNMHTTATFIYSEFEQGSTSLGMAMALVAVVLTTMMLVFVEHMQNRWKAKHSS